MTKTKKRLAGVLVLGGVTLSSAFAFALSCIDSTSETLDLEVREVQVDGVADESWEVGDRATAWGGDNAVTLQFATEDTIHGELRLEGGQ